MNAVTPVAGRIISRMRRYLSRPQDEMGFVVKERYVVCGDIAGKHLFHSTAGWVDDQDCAVVFIRQNAAEMARTRLEAHECDKITNVCVERIE